MLNEHNIIKWFDQLGLSNISEVGGKNANIGELNKISQLIGIQVPSGFAITTKAYSDFIKYNSIEKKIDELSKNLLIQNSNHTEIGLKIRKLILQGKFDPQTKDKILSNFKILKTNIKDKFAVRSSAITEDLPLASFAGLHDSFLNVSSGDELINFIIRCYASLFNDRAISYRSKKNIPASNLKISVGIQKMIRSDVGVSGVMFTVDTETGYDNNIIIESSYGLGESIVKGTITPDQFIIFKPTLNLKNSPIIEKKLGTKEIKTVYSDDFRNNLKTKEVSVSIEDRNRFSLSDEEILKISTMGLEIENYYSKLNSYKTYMDIEWAKDGLDGNIYILQARPETVHSQRKLKDKLWKKHQLLKKGPIITKGISVGSTINSGYSRIIHQVSDIHQLKVGEVLVTDKTNPDWEPAMKIASAVVTNRGGRTCHAAIISREIGIPAVVGTGNATLSVHDHQLVTVSSAEGPEGYVYEGELPVKITTITETETSNLKTKIFLNIANSEESTILSFLPNDGVGLARIEFLISSSIQIHPMAIAKFDEIKDSFILNKISKITKSYSSPKVFFVETLAQKIGTIVSSFFPKPVLVRFSDFKSNEYANLIGGNLFEKNEENPMIGFRGAYRYAHPNYKDGFALECQAVRRVFEIMGLKNLRILIPFCRTVKEAELVIQELSKNGISKNSGFEIWMMCEIPSNVLNVEAFSKFFDGFSIGSNDLTQLTLGIDRDSEELSSSFNEKDPSVLKLIKEMISTSKSLGKKVSICGQGPSDDPEFTRLLVQMGIDSISFNPDSVLKMIPVIRDAEKDFIKGVENEKEKKGHTQSLGLQPS